MKQKYLYSFGLGLGCGIPIVWYYPTIIIIIDLIMKINVGKFYNLLLVLVWPISSYFAMQFFNKFILIAASHITTKANFLNLITVVITSLSMMVVLDQLNTFNNVLNDNDLGIILEITGFFIVLNPFKKSLLFFIKSDDDIFVNHELITKTTAVILVAAGLILQLSYFS